VSKVKADADFYRNRRKQRRSSCADLGKLVLLIFFSPYFLHWWPSLCGAKVSAFLTRFSFLAKFISSETKLQIPRLQKITASSSKRSQPAAAGGGGGGTSNPCASDASSAQEETLFVPYCLLGGWRKQEMQMDREVLTGGRPGDPLLIQRVASVLDRTPGEPKNSLDERGTAGLTGHRPQLSPPVHIKKNPRKPRQERCKDYLGLPAAAYLRHVPTTSLRNFSAPS
jgi:hypothetical protein